MFEIEIQFDFDGSAVEELLATRAKILAEDVGIDLGIELQRTTPVAFGKTQAGWDVASTGEGLNFGVTVSNATEYAYYAIAGRGPGKAPPAGPGSGLERWARLKGMARGASFGIARKIGQEGTDRWKSRRNALDIDPITQELRPGSPVRMAQGELIKNMKNLDLSQ